MAKVMFSLRMANGVSVRELEDLIKHFDITTVLAYYDDGRLVEWLKDRGHYDQAEKIKALDSSAPDFKKQLCEILGAPYEESKAFEVDMSDVSTKNERLRRLREFTSNDKIHDAVDNVAFTQEELTALVDKDVDTIYLCGERFEIPGKGGMKYIGLNNPKVEIPENFYNKNISFQNVDLSIDEIVRCMKEAHKNENSAECIKLECIAAELGNAEAQCWYGNSYNTGYGGLEKNYVEAVKWFLKSAEQGYDAAQYHLGNYYYEGKGVEQNYVEAVKWYLKSAEQEYARAQYMMGSCYSEGKGLEKNDEKSTEWYIKAAEQGQTWAQNALGLKYWNGKGVGKNREKANMWFLKSAEQGYSSAQNNIGTSYRDGDGIEKNEEKAIEWLTKAYKQGHKDAKNALIGLIPKQFKLSEVILYAIGGKENLSFKDGINIISSTNEIKIYVKDRHKVKDKVLSSYGATNIQIETRYIRKIVNQKPTIKNLFSAFKETISDGIPSTMTEEKRVDEGNGIIHINLQKINPEDITGFSEILGYEPKVTANFTKESEPFHMSLGG
jgi:TPR repeat protein